MRRLCTLFRLPLALVVALAMSAASCSSGTTDTTATPTVPTTVSVTTTTVDTMTASSGDVAMTWVFASSDWPYSGSVTLTGSAVDDGIVCASGQGDNSTLDEISRDDEGTTYRLDAEVTCDDGSGSFLVWEDATIPVGGGFPLGVWTIESGTGDYAQLTGNGTSEDVGNFTDNTTTKIYVGEMSRG